MNSKTEQYLFYSILSITFIIIGYICFSTQAPFDSGDGLQHYFMARYSWENPKFFLDLWAKPLFTLIASPFAQFGLKGVNLFQIICALSTSFLCYKIAHRLEIKNAFVLPIIICFAPVYFPILLTGLTEIFFGFLIVVAIYLTVEKKFLLAALVVSFIPFARNEGYMFFPLFILIFLYRRQFWQIPFMGTGTLVLSIIGYFVFNNIGWLFHKNPYTGAEDIYGHGELLSFVKQYNQIFGLLMTVLALLGIVWVTAKLTVSKKINSSFFPEELFLVYGCAIAYFSAHSIFWWQGIFSSLGLERMMAAIIPLVALLSLRGLNAIVLPYKHYKFVPLIAALFYGGGAMLTAFNQWYFPFKLSMTEEVIASASKWYQSSKVSKQKIFYIHPFFPYILDFNPFDRTKAESISSIDKEHPETSMKNNEVLFWDAHFSPNEGRLDLNILHDNPNFRLLKKFIPKHEFTVLGGRKFEIYIFQKKDFVSIKDSVIPYNSPIKYDLENPKDYPDSYKLSSEKPFAGKYSCKLSDMVEYGITIKHPVSHIKSIADSTFINATFKVNSNTEIKEAYLVAEILGKGSKQVYWKGNEIKEPATGNSWKPFSTLFYIPHEYMNPENTIVFYVWNKAKINFYLDDIILTYQKNSIE